MSTTGKLNINGLLCYISTAKHSYPEKAFVSVCLSFFITEKISEANELLFPFTNESITWRRGEGKSKAELQDIIAIFRKFDEDVTTPSLVADSCKSMPPASCFEVLAEQIVYFISEIALLKDEVRELRVSKEGKRKIG